MSRYGTSIVPGRQRAHVMVTVVEHDGKTRHVTWRGKNKHSIMRAAKRAYPDAKLSFGNVWYETSYGAHENPTAAAVANKPSDVELIVGGVAAIALVGFGIYVIYQATNPSGSSTATTLEDTSSLAALGVLV
jgi:uncharacterized protein GlcG (DUF336 family)